MKGESFPFPANATKFNSSECEAALEGLDNLEDVICSRETLAATGGATFHIGKDTILSVQMFSFLSTVSKTYNNIMIIRKQRDQRMQMMGRANYRDEEDQQR